MTIELGFLMLVRKKWSFCCSWFPYL